MRPVPRRPLLHLVIALLLTAGPLFAALPEADAQTIRLGSPAEAYQYGWTFPEGGEFPGGELDDATGDVVATDAAEVPVGAAPVRGELDLVRLRLDEPDRETLRLSLQVGDLDTQRMLLEDPFGSTSYEIDLTIAGQAYTISSYLYVGCGDENAAGFCDSFTSPALVWSARLYEVHPDDRRPVGLLPTQVLPDADRMELLLPRWALDRAGASKAPYAGDAVGDVTVVSGANSFCFIPQTGCTGLRDRLPDDGVAPDLHVLSLESNGARLRVLDGRGPVEADERGYMPLAPLRPRELVMDVVPGPIAQVPVRVENLAGTKALVLTDAEVVSGHDVPVRVPESLEVPAGDVRKLLLTLNGTDTLTLQDPLVLRLQLETVGPRPAYDTVTLVVRAVPVLSTESPRLFLHTYNPYEGDVLQDNGVDIAYRAAVLNTLEDDPLDDGHGVVANDWCFCINRPYGWQGQSGVPARIDLDNETPATLHLSLDAPVAGTLVVEPVLTYGDLTVAYASSDVDLEQGTNEVDVPLYIDDESAVLEPGEAVFRLDLRATFRPGGILLSEFVALAEPVNPTLNTQGASWVELPIIDPAQRFADATHVSLDLQRGVDRVQYLNPGRSTLWNVTILNQADKPDMVTLAVDAPEDWKTEVHPGKSYRLGPGESVTVGVRAQAPAKADEGTTAQILVTLASGLAEGAQTGISLSAVVTKGVAIDEPAYVADNETSARLADKTTTAESPLSATLLIPLVVAVLVALRRRGAHA